MTRVDSLLQQVFKTTSRLHTLLQKYRSNAENLGRMLFGRPLSCCTADWL